jgi:hypothetical protein
MQLRGPSRLDAISRMSALKSGDQKVSNPHRIYNASNAQEHEDLSQPGPKPRDDLLASYEETLTSVGPSSDRLLAEPSLLANSLFQFWVVPREAANSLLRIYANHFLVAAGSNAQLNSAFSSASPDDVVQNAQRQSKGSVHSTHV